MQAAKWYQKAAEQGDESARQSLEDPDFQFELAECYYFGRQTAEDEAEAVQWYQKAAWQGHKGAMEALSLCYRHGRGVSRSLIQAAIWQLRSKGAR